jgi:hypothetical protein
MTIDNIYEDLELIKKVFRTLIVTENYAKNSSSEISWKNYSAGIFKNIYAKEFEYIIKNRQYSFLLKDDKGCVQFYYLYKGKTLQKVKMAYYPYPVVLREDKDEIETLLSDSEDEVLMEYYYDIWNILNHQFELKMDDNKLKTLIAESIEVGNNENVESLLLGRFEYKYLSTNSSHLRVDFDSKVESHHKCEIQIGAINDIRFPMSKLISPFTFFEFIIKNLFSKDKDYKRIIGKGPYKAMCNNSKKNAIVMNPFIESNIFLHISK